MLLVDANVLIYAHRKDVADHLRYRQWLESTINSEFKDLKWRHPLDSSGSYFFDATQVIIRTGP